MASDRYGIFSGTFSHAAGTLNLQQLRQQSLNATSRYRLIRPGGALNPAAHILSTANPVIRFVSNDLFTCLTTVDIANGLFCTGGHVMRYQYRLPGGAFGVGANHYTQSTAKGFLHITGIDVDIDSEEGASCELEYIPLSVAGENPIVNTPLVDFTSAPAPTYMSQYYMGGSWLGAGQIETLTRLRITPGIQYTARRCDGGVFARVGASSINARQPAIEATYLNAALPAVLGSFFTNAMTSTYKTYLQRATTAADGRIAVATPNHIRFDVAAGSWGHDNIQVADEGDAGITVAIMPTGLLACTLGVTIP